MKIEEALRQSEIIDRNHSLFHAGVSNSPGNKSHKDLIKEIYDGFESRTCENCELRYKESNNSYCRIRERTPVEYQENFSCSIWKAKA
jgi:hypothetical protein